MHWRSLCERAERLGTSFEVEREAARTSVPLGRPGTPQDVAAAEVFLASESAAYITGATLIVDGGLMVS